MMQVNQSGQSGISFGRETIEQLVVKDSFNGITQIPFKPGIVINPVGDDKCTITTPPFKIDKLQKEEVYAQGSNNFLIVYPNTDSQLQGPLRNGQSVKVNDEGKFEVIA